MFDPDAPHSCLTHDRYGCGSFCCLSNMLIDVGRQHEHVIGFWDIDSVLLRDCKEESKRSMITRATFPRVWSTTNT